MRVKNEADQLNFHCFDAPTVVSLVHHTGVEGDHVFRGGGEAASVGLTDLGHGHYLIGAGPQLGGQRDLVPQFQGMDLPKVVVGAPVVRRHRNISAPNRGFLEVTGTLGQGLLSVPS